MPTPPLELLPITEKVNWSANDLERALTDELNALMKDAQGDFKATTRSWKTKVDFILMNANRDGDRLIAAAGTNNKVYGYVTRGTRAHIIRPRRARALRFQTGYRAKTSKRVLNSGSGGATGDVVYSQNVLHPGTEAREFEEAVADKYQAQIQQRLQAAINKVVNR